MFSMFCLMLCGCSDDVRFFGKDTVKTEAEKNTKNTKNSKKSEEKSNTEKSDIEKSDTEKNDSVQGFGNKESLKEDSEGNKNNDSYNDEGNIEQSEEEIKKVENNEVEIEGNNYLEIPYIETESDVYYDFEDYVVTVVSTWEEVGTDLISESDDGMKASFMIGIQEPKKIRTKEVTVDFNKLEANKKQFGNTIFENGEISDLFRKGEVRGISFGRAYFDYDNTLYVDVFITGSKLMYSSTIEITLD